MCLLIKLLRENMIRHTKHSIVGIPQPIYRVTRLVLSHEESRAYNALVALAKVNLILTGFDYKNPGASHPDSFVNPLNKKALNEVLLNIR